MCGGVGFGKSGTRLLWEGQVTLIGGGTPPRGGELHGGSGTWRERVWKREGPSAWGRSVKPRIWGVADKGIQSLHLHPRGPGPRWEGLGREGGAYFACQLAGGEGRGGPFFSRRGLGRIGWLRAPAGPAWSAPSACPQLQDLFNSSPKDHSVTPALSPQMPEAPSVRRSPSQGLLAPRQPDCPSPGGPFLVPSWARSL